MKWTNVNNVLINYCPIKNKQFYPNLNKSNTLQQKVSFNSEFISLDFKVPNPSNIYVFCVYSKRSFDMLLFPDALHLVLLILVLKKNSHKMSFYSNSSSYFCMVGEYFNKSNE